MTEGEHSRVRRLGESAGFTSQEQLVWLGTALQERRLIGAPLEAVKSHSQEFMMTTGRNTCTVAAAQNVDRLLRGTDSRYQRMSTDEILTLLPRNPFLEDPRGMDPSQLTALLQAMGFTAGHYLRGNIPAITTVLEQGGAVIEHGGPDKHARVIANVHRARTILKTHKNPLDYSRAAKFGILDSISPSSNPYDVSALDFMARLERFGTETSYIGVVLPQSTNTGGTRVKIRR